MRPSACFSCCSDALARRRRAPPARASTAASAAARPRAPRRGAPRARRAPGPRSAARRVDPPDQLLVRGGERARSSARSSPSAGASFSHRLRASIAPRSRSPPRDRAERRATRRTPCAARSPSSPLRRRLSCRSALIRRSAASRGRRRRPQLGVERVPMRLERPRDQRQPVGQPAEAPLVARAPARRSPEAAGPGPAPRSASARASTSRPVDRQRGLRPPDCSARRARSRSRGCISRSISWKRGIVAQALAGRILSVQRAEPWSEIEHGTNPPRVTEQCAIHRTNSARCASFRSTPASAAGIDKLLGHRQDLDVSGGEHLVRGAFAKHATDSCSGRSSSKSGRSV